MENGKSRIRSEIRALMRDFKQDKQELSAKFTFPADFIGFSGHFPGNPIVPGICQIQCVLELLSKSVNTVVTLAAVDRAKFINMVIPEEEILVTGNFKKNANKISGSFKITKKPHLHGERKKEISVSRLKITGKIARKEEKGN